jgi:hypothetical protein
MSEISCPFSRDHRTTSSREWYAACVCYYCSDYPVYLFALPHRTVLGWSTCHILTLSRNCISRLSAHDVWILVTARSTLLFKLQVPTRPPLIPKPCHAPPAMFTSRHAGRHLAGTVAVAKACRRQESVGCMSALLPSPRHFFPLLPLATFFLAQPHGWARPRVPALPASHARRREH